MFYYYEVGQITGLVDLFWTMFCLFGSRCWFGSVKPNAQPVYWIKSECVWMYKAFSSFHGLKSWYQYWYRPMIF